MLGLITSIKFPFGSWGASAHQKRPGKHRDSHILQRFQSSDDMDLRILRHFRNSDDRDIRILRHLRGSDNRDLISYDTFEALKIGTYVSYDTSEAPTIGPYLFYDTLESQRQGPTYFTTFLELQGGPRSSERPSWGPPQKHRKCFPYPYTENVIRRSLLFRVSINFIFGSWEASMHQKQAGTPRTPQILQHF